MTNADWRYTRDGLDQLTIRGRGTLQTPPAGGLASTNFLQVWTLDLAGNWPGFNEGKGTNRSLIQTRAHDLVNEITADFWKHRLAQWAAWRTSTPCAA